MGKSGVSKVTKATRVKSSASRKRQKVTIYSIAREAGVSVPTVSRVINRKAGITEETRNKVNGLLKRYNFRPSYPAMRTVKIAVVYPWADLSNYFRKAMKGIYDYAHANGLMVNIIIAQSHRKESLLEAVRDQQCSGVIAMLTETYRREIEGIGNTDLPVVVIDAVVHDQTIGFIDNNSYSGASEAAKHLIDLGHRKIGYITYSQPSLNQIQRFKGAENMLKSYGIELSADSVIQLEMKQATMAPGENGYNAMKKLLDRNSNITAVMAVDDSMALGALAAIHDAGLRVPEDISLVGFDNHAETQYWHPPLTTVEHPVGKAGEMAIKAIHAGLKLPASTWTPPREILPTSLVVRKSTCPPRS